MNRRLPRCGHGRPAAHQCWLCAARFSPALYWEGIRLTQELRKVTRRAS